MACLGCLSYNPYVTFNMVDLYRNKKEITGIMMYEWIGALTSEERQRIYKRVADDLKNGGKIFGTKVTKTVALKDFKQAIQDSENDATQGKYLIDCQMAH